MFEITDETKEKIASAVKAVSQLQGIHIELIGAWVWISGDTKQHKEILKNAGYKWAHKKCMWYFAGIPSHHSRADMWYLKSKYGAYVINGDNAISIE